jgi:hypothetical protein
MSEERDLSRQAIRAALRIREQLSDAAGRPGVGALPTGRWDELRRVFRRYEHAQQRGWFAAGEAVLGDLNYQLRRLMAELEVVGRDLPHIGQRGPVAPQTLCLRCHELKTKSATKA